MAETRTPEHPLKALTSTSNLMLVSTGKFFQNAASANQRPLVMEKKVLQAIATTANNHFHEALDEIETDILRAKAVMERDLRKIRAKRAEREKAAGILTRPAGITKSKSPTTEAKRSSLADGTIIVKESEKEHTPKAQAANGDKAAGDTTAQELNHAQIPPEIEPIAANEDSGPKGSNAADTQAPFTITQPLRLDPSVGLAIDLQPDAQAPKQLESATKPEQPPLKALDEPLTNSPVDLPTSTNDEAVPFESMFNDLENPENPTSLDFDLGFPSSGADLLNDAAFDNIVNATSNDDQTLNVPPTTAEDIDSILPGLDSYVNSDGDFSMLDMNIPPTAAMPEMSTSIANTTVPAPAATSINEGGQQLQMDSAPMESSFDDLFGGSGDWGMDDDMGGTMGDFNDDWFKTDG